MFSYKKYIMAVLFTAMALVAMMYYGDYAMQLSNPFFLNAAPEFTRTSPGINSLTPIGQTVNNPVKVETGILPRLYKIFNTEMFIDDFIAFNPGIKLLNPNYAKKARVTSLYRTYGFNSAVENRLHYYSKKSKREFQQHLSRGGKYLETMANIFREKNLPEELIFLPLIESGYRIHAYSPKRAVGQWQFMYATAKSYGLKIDWWVDERKDPVKSTTAAAEYLNDLYNIFGSWSLSIAAYNAGEGNIMNAVKRAKTDDFWSLRKTRFIHDETKNYVPSYIAAAAIALSPESFGFKDIDYLAPLKYDEVVINSPISLQAVADFTDTEPGVIRELNPELKRWCTPPNVSRYTLKIPSGTKGKLIYSLLNAGDEELFYVEFYTVEKGDTVSAISRRFGVTSQAIIDINSLNKEAFIMSGSRILIPAKKARAIVEQMEVFGSIRPVLKKSPDKWRVYKTSALDV